VQISSVRDSLSAVFSKLSDELVTTNTTALDEGRKFAEKQAKNK